MLTLNESLDGTAPVPAAEVTQSGPLLTASSLTLGYSRTASVLEDISFEVGPGLTLLLGANGAGKSTLISTLARAHRPRRGGWTFSLGGKQLGDRESRLATGLLPQSPAFSARMTGLQCVDYVAWLRRVARAERQEQARVALASANATHVSDVPWARMSYGTRQRVAIAAALVNRPALLLLDEPMNGLDIGEKHSLMEVLTALPWPCVSFVSSHVVEGLEDIVTNVLILSNGSLAYAGAAADLIDKHGSLERAYLQLQEQG